MTQEGTKDLAHYDGGGSSRADSAIWYYLGILRRRIWIILPILVISGTIGLIRAFRAPKFYRASARVLVERFAPDLMQFDRGMSDRMSWDPDFYTTQAQLIRSRAVMDVALKQPGVRECYDVGSESNKTAVGSTSFLSEIRNTLVALLGAAPPPPPEPWQLLRDSVTTIHITDTHFIEIRVVNGDPQRAAMLANASAAGFQEYHRQKKLETLGEAFVMLQKEKEKEETELLKAEKELQAFRETAKGVTVDKSKTDQPAIDRLVKLNEQLTDVQLKRIELSAEIAVMQDVLRGRDEVARKSEDRLYSIPVIQTDQILADAKKKLTDAEKELATLSETYGAEHPLIVAGKSKVTLSKDQFKKALNEIVASQSNRLKALQGQEADLQAEVEEQKKVALELAKEEFSFARLQGNVDRHRKLFDSLVERMREVDVSSGLAKTNVQIVETAAVPTIPIGAGKLRVLLLALVVGLFLGGGLAFIAENLDDTVKTPEDLRERLDLPLLGFVPAIEAADADGVEEAPSPGAGETAGTPFRDIKPSWRERVHGVLSEFLPFIEKPQTARSEAGRSQRGRTVLMEPMSSVAEAYRSIRASLFYSTPADEIKVLAITSCRPQEGKTTTSTNLALSIAQTGKKVLLIDGDLHRPSVHRTLGIDPSDGLTSVLVGEVSLQDAISHVEKDGKPVENLAVLAAGPSSPNPSELLNSNKMKELLASAKKAYDWVIVDTPPVLFVSDARIISVMCDGVLVVVKSGTSTRSLLIRARELLDSVKARVIGSILNDVRVSRMGRHYSSYYSYGYSRYARDYKSHYYQRGDGEERSEEKDADRQGKVKRRDRKPQEEGADAQVEGKEQKPVDRGLRMTPVDQARLHLEAGNPGRARTILEEQVEARPDMLDAWEMLIAVAVLQKDEAALRKNMERFRDLRGSQGYIYAYGTGHIALMQSDINKARECFEEALAMKPGNPRLLESLLRVDLAQARVDPARSRAQKLLEVEPDNAYGHYVTGTLLLLDGDQEGAEAALRKSIGSRQSTEALNDLAWILHKRGHLQEAEGMARAALEIDSRSFPVWDTLGLILMDADRLEEAETAFGRAMTLSGGDVDTILGMATLQMKKGQRDGTRELVEKLLPKRQQLSRSEQDTLANIERWLSQG